MGLELIFLTYAVGLLPLVYGLHVVIVGRIHVISSSQEPLTGPIARLLGLSCIIMAIEWFIAMTWAWGKYGRH